MPRVAFTGYRKAGRGHGIFAVAGRSVTNGTTSHQRRHCSCLASEDEWTPCTHQVGQTRNIFRTSGQLASSYLPSWLHGIRPPQFAFTGCTNLSILDHPTTWPPFILPDGSWSPSCPQFYRGGGFRAVKISHGKSLYKKSYGIIFNFLKDFYENISHEFFPNEI